MYKLDSPQSHISLSSTQVSLLALFVIWELVWKGIGLWRAGRNNQFGWFLIMLVVNSLGIVEMIYLFSFQKKTETKND
jgi:divalent metal cation (Fe/Co/Zn/Cd) transporter